MKPLFREAGASLQLLSRLLLPGSPLSKPESLAAAVRGLPDPEELLEAAVDHGMTGLLYRALASAERDHGFPDEHWHRLREWYYRTIRDNLLRLGDCAELVAALSASGITVMVLQGVSLLLTVYRDPGLRPTGDLDIWVPEDRLPELVRCAETMGFLQDSLYPQTFCRNGRVLDVHTHLLWADRLRHRERISPRMQQLFLEKARTVHVEKATALCLGLYDQFIYLCMHLIKHGCNHLVWLADLFRISAAWSSEDWKALQGRSRQLGVDKQVGFILNFMLASRLTLSGDESAIAGAAEPTALHRWFLRRWIRYGGLPYGTPLLLLTSGMKGSDRFFYGWEAAFPSPTVLRQIFPGVNGSDDHLLHMVLRRIFQLAARVLPRQSGGADR